MCKALICVGKEKKAGLGQGRAWIMTQSQKWFSQTQGVLEQGLLFRSEWMQMSWERDMIFDQGTLSMRKK